MAIMKQSVSLLLHNIRSVYNVGSIFRTAECLGVEKIYLSGYTPAPVDRFGRARSDFHKVALGTEKVIAWEQVKDYTGLIKGLKHNSYEIVALEQVSDSQLLQNFVPIQPILLIPGTETTGVDPELVEMCDTTVEIAQQGTKESLNVHTATAIACWHLLH